MYAQLGTTMFDGYKSFITFSQGEEAVIVEHALIGRKPRLEGAGLGARTVDITLFLHQEFCKVADEIASLRKSLNTFEILPLLWGNGKKEGRFIIKQMDSENVFQDPLGNLLAANVHLVIVETVDDPLDQQQQDAQNSAFGTGSKNPATKSKRVNPESCQKQISTLVSQIRSYGSAVNLFLGVGEISGGTRVYLQNIVRNCGTIISGTLNPQSCVFNNIPLQQSANNVRASADGLDGDIGSGEFPNSTLRDENTILQSAIGSLCKTAAPITQQNVAP